MAVIKKEPLINCLQKRIAALGGACKFAYLLDMSPFLRSVRLALYPLRLISQRFHETTVFVRPENKLRVSLLLALFFSWSAFAAVLPDDRVDILYHGYDGGGAEIDGPSILVRKNFANKVSVSANYYADMVSSASVDVLATASPYSEERDEYSVGVEYLRNKTTMSLGYTNSSENDYEAQTVGFSISQDFFGDLSTLTMSYVVGDDEVRENGNDTFAESVERQQFGISLSQILSKNLIVNLQVETVVDEGFLNNPYRQVRYVDPAETIGYAYEDERYPNTRNSDAVALRALYYLPWNASIKAEYRNYTDSWGISADNYEMGYIHTFWDENLVAEFKYRNYSQTAADFYNDLFPFRNAQNFLARDKELSTYTNNSFGIGLSYELPWKLHQSIDRMTINLYWDHMQFDYDDFRNVTVAAPSPGQEPLYSFDADVIRLFLSVWY